ncbi:MAG: response regulator [Bacteroidota bacterium]
MHLKLVYTEDCEADRKLFQIVLREIGYPVELIICQNGEDLLKELAKPFPFSFSGSYRPVDLFITDLHLPDLEGIELTKRIRANPIMTHSSIAIYSGTIHEKKVQDSYAAGTNFFLYKPMAFHEWVYSLNGLLSFVRTIQRPRPKCHPVLKVAS